MLPAGVAAAGRDKEERAGNVRVQRSLGVNGATAGKTNNNSSKGAHVNTSAVLRHSNGDTTDKASPATVAVGAAAASRNLAPAGGRNDVGYLSSDNSDEEMAAIGWQDDDPIRSKVGNLLAKYGRVKEVNATSHSKEAVKAAPPDRKYEPHNNMKSRELPEDMHVTFKGDKMIDDEYVIIEGMDLHDTSTETSVEPQSGSDGARSASDINDDSFEDLEWDSDLMVGVQTRSMETEAEDEVDNAILMSELRAAVAASLASVDMEDEGQRNQSPPPSRSFLPGESHYQTDASSAARYENKSQNNEENVFIGDNDEERQVNYEFHSYATDNANAFSRIGRYPRMFPLQDDECSDSLSIITELTEPDNESGRFSSRSSTPATDSRRSYSRSSTPIQKPRSSTPSTIEELDTEDEILARPPSEYKDSKKTTEQKRTTETLKTTKSSRTVAGVEVDSSQNNSPQPDSMESDHSSSQTSECSATESAQESHPPSTDGYGSKKLLIDERRDSFDVLAESSLPLSAAVDFAEVYEANKKYVDATECDFNENEIRNNTISPAKPVRNKSPSKDKEKIDRKSAIESKKKTVGNLAKEASEVVKRTKRSKEPGSVDSFVESRTTDTLKVEMRKKKSEGKESPHNSAIGTMKVEEKVEHESDDLAESYKEVRKSLTHVERNEDTYETKGKRRKMSDGVVVDSTPMASLTKLTKMFDVAPAYMRAGSPRPSDSDRRVSTSTNSSGEQPMDAREEDAKRKECSVVTVDEQPILMRKGRKHRETYVMDSDDVGPMNISDLGRNEGICGSGNDKEVDTEQIESLNAKSCPSHSSFNEGLKVQEDSPSLTSSLKPSKSSGESQPRSAKKVTIRINDEEIGESATDDLLDDSAIEHISQGDNKVLEVIIPDKRLNDEEHIEEESAATTQNEQSRYHSIAEENQSGHPQGQPSSVYYSANSETPLQITRINRRNEHYDNRNSSRLSEIPREASILDEDYDDDDDDDRYLNDTDYSRPDSADEVSGGEALGSSSGRYNNNYGGVRHMVVDYNTNTSHDRYYGTESCGDGRFEGGYNINAYAQGHHSLGLETISEGESELTHDHEASGTVSRTSWASSDYSPENSTEYHHYSNKAMQVKDTSRSENDGSWSSRSRSSGSEESIQSNSSHDGYSSNDWDHSKSDNRKSCVSFDSLDVYLDCDSDTAEERAHPEKFEEDFALSLDLGPRLDPNHNYSSTPLKRGLREQPGGRYESSESDTQLAHSKHTRSVAGTSLHDFVVLSEQHKQDVESGEKMHLSKDKMEGWEELALPKHPTGSASGLLCKTTRNSGGSNQETRGDSNSGHLQANKSVNQSSHSKHSSNSASILHSSGDGKARQTVDSRKFLSLPKHPPGSASSLLYDISYTNSTQPNVHPEHASSLSNSTDSTPKASPTEAGDTFISSGMSFVFFPFLVLFTILVVSIFVLNVRRNSYVVVSRVAIQISQPS